MPFYEHVYLARQDLAAGQVETLTGELTQIITDHEGTVKSSEYWGLRNLAYRIHKNRKAHYVLLNIEAPAPAIVELERQVRINEDIIRYQTVRVDKLEEGPSPIARKSDRSTRKRPRRHEQDD